jgi:hypothetical protein
MFALIYFYELKIECKTTDSAYTQPYLDIINYFSKNKNVTAMSDLKNLVFNSASAHDLILKIKSSLL